MSNQIKEEISKTKEKINQLKKADEENKSKAMTSWGMGDYGHGNFYDQISVSNPEIKRLEDYTNSLNGVLNMWGTKQEKLQAFDQIKVAHKNTNPEGYGEGVRRRYKKKSLKRKSRKSGKTKKRNTRRRK